MGPDGGVQTLSVEIDDAITMKQIADYMGFIWSMSESELKVDNATLQYTSGDGGLALAVSAVVGFPIIAFEGAASLQITGRDSLLFLVSCAGSQQSPLGMPLAHSSIWVLQASDPAQIIPGVIVNPQGNPNGFKLAVGNNSFAGSVDAEGE